MARLTPGCARGLQTGASSRSAQTLWPTPPKPPPPWLTAIMAPTTWKIWGRRCPQSTARPCDAQL
eukprot:7776105-Pyramimonas_sp.AAC.1